ncbi:conserved Plasmodium protein, unknown function [Plasmodium relictum]|uniref:Uncharacterized protein n=1 Tax=Plasmodium relictum TaxID=85471 RepID=A0A1J1H2V6_PLARL|nr:conserved Plasmodium protein, unknown function [Plasmodium relictum]CRG98879.1 conserved Plasmodium protein, unknown function [Plasmodium relictum]
MEEKFLQTHITILFYLILLFYLKNFTVNLTDIPKKLLNYIKVYYSFLIILTVAGFFSRLIILIQIFTVQKINEILNSFLKRNTKNVKIKRNLSFNKDLKKSKLTKKRLSDKNNNIKDSKNNCIDKLNHDQFSEGFIDINKKNYINNNEDVNKYDKKRETYNLHITKVKKRNNGKYIENDNIKSEDLMEIDKKGKIKSKMKNSQDIETDVTKKGNVNFDIYSNKQKYNFFTNFSNIICSNENFVKENNNINYNTNKNINSSVINNINNNINNSTNKNANNNNINNNLNDNIYNNIYNSFIDNRYNNSSCTLINEMNIKINNTFTKSKKIPLKSILKKNNLSNGTLKIKNQEIKNNKHIRFNSDIETYFFEKYSFEEDTYNNNNCNKKKFYKILDTYNLISWEIFSYSNLRHNLNLVFIDIINSVFVFKDKLVAKF